MEMTIPGYELEPYCTELIVRVLRVGEDGGRPFAVLDRTILYPEGGGQLADRGWLAGEAFGEVEVVDVRKAADGPRHVTATPVAVGEARLRLDWMRRYDHMQQHTAQHLLTAIALDRFGWRTTSFHMREEMCDIELDVPMLEEAILRDLEEAAAAEIRAHRAISARRVSAPEMDALVASGRLRTRGLPEGHQGSVRLIEIEGVDLNTCGGTHLRTTGEIEALKLLATESIRGGTRLHWVAGGRVRRRLAAHEARNAALRKVLGTGDDELVATAEGKLAQLKEAQRREKALLARLAAAEADRLATLGRLVDRHFEDADAGFLQAVARRFQEAAPDGATFLTASGEKGAFFVVAAGERTTFDVVAAGRGVADVLGARGGGSGRLFQGKMDGLGGRDAAWALLRGMAEG